MVDELCMLGLLRQRDDGMYGKNGARSQARLTRRRTVAVACTTLRY